MNIRRAKILLARAAKERELAAALVLREAVQRDVFGDSFPVRYDFGYIDPADGSYRQIYLDVVMSNDNPAERDERVVGFVKDVIARMLWRKCGFRAIENQKLLPLPRWVKGRYV